jgi:hypothetical protein
MFSNDFNKMTACTTGRGFNFFEETHVTDQMPRVHLFEWYIRGTITLPSASCLCLVQVDTIERASSGGTFGAGVFGFVVRAHGTYFGRWHSLLFGCWWLVVGDHYFNPCFRHFSRPMIFFGINFRGAGGRVLANLLSG